MMGCYSEDAVEQSSGGFSGWKSVHIFLKNQCLKLMGNKISMRPLDVTRSYEDGRVIKKSLINLLTSPAYKEEALSWLSIPEEGE
jgi:hypothetical protein